MTTDDLPEIVSIAYRSPTGHTHAVLVADVAYEFVFPFSELSQALSYDIEARISPACPKEGVRTLRLAGSKHPRKCIVLDSIFKATQRSKETFDRDDGQGDAAHFHAWLETVVIPLTELDHWPPTELEISARQIAYREGQRDAWAASLAEIPSYVPPARASGVADPYDVFAGVDDIAKFVDLKKPLTDEQRGQRSAQETLAVMRAKIAAANADNL
jgi:hypothetical protein